jgi:hypothetical protein
MLSQSSRRRASSKEGKGDPHRSTMIHVNINTVIVIARRNWWLPQVFHLRDFLSSSVRLVIPGNNSGLRNYCSVVREKMGVVRKYVQDVYNAEA